MFSLCSAEADSSSAVITVIGYKVPERGFTFRFPAGTKEWRSLRDVQNGNEVYTDFDSMALSPQGKEVRGMKLLILFYLETRLGMRQSIPHLSPHAFTRPS
jgi:hypothetical protein